MRQGGRKNSFVDLVSSYFKKLWVGRGKFKKTKRIKSSIDQPGKTNASKPL
jgi:hypothetical protein